MSDTKKEKNRNRPEVEKRLGFVSSIARSIDSILSQELELKSIIECIRGLAFIHDLIEDEIEHNTTRLRTINGSIPNLATVMPKNM